MKKIISVLCSIAILLSAVIIAIPSLADTSTPEKLLISDCESLTGWTKTSGQSLSVNPNGFTGKAVAVNVDKGCFRDTTFTTSPIDISSYQNIQWDVMMHTGAQPGMWEDIAAVYGELVCLKIGSSATDYNIYRLSKMEVQQDSNNKLWYHFSVNLDDPSSTTGSFDMTKMTTFNFATMNNDNSQLSSSVRNGHVRIDNIYAANVRKEKPEEIKDLILSECETLDGWGYSGNVSNVASSPNGMTNKAVQIYTGYGALRKMSFSANADLSKYNVIEFDMMCMKQNDTSYDMWSEITAAYGDKIAIEVSDGTAVNTYGLNKWKVTALGNCWYHVAINVLDPTSSTGTLDLAKFSSFSIYTNTTATLDTTVNTAIFRLDNLLACFDENMIVVDETITLTDCETVDGWVYSGNASNMQLNANGLSGNAVYVYTGYGALRKLTYTHSADIDLSKYHTFEFDFQCFKSGDTSFDMWSAIKNSYGNYIGVEISDGTNTQKIALSDMVITEGANRWYHAAVSVPSDSKVDLSEFKSFAFYTLPATPLDTTLPDAIFRIDNLIAVLGEGEPSKPETQGVWPIEGSFQKKTQGTFSFILNQFEYDLSAYKKSDLYLTMRVYIENTDGSDDVLDFTKEGQIELTSSGECDKQEANWTVPKLGLKSGWNELRLLISNADFDNGLNLSSINYLRFYSVKAGEDEFNVRIEDVAITNLKEETVVNSYFADGMMFQQNKPMNIFGNVSAANLAVEAKLYKGEALLETKTATSAQNGAFSLSFTARAGGYDTYKIEIYVGGQLKKTISDILIGELWLAAGQSNMEFFVLQTIKDYDYSLIPLNEKVRFFDIPLVPGGTSATLPASGASDIEGAKWADGSNAVDVKYISAIAYYMSLELQAKLDVPVGFINAAKGASVIESWLPREVVENDKAIKDVLVERNIYLTEDQLGRTGSNWTYLTTLYNSKIAPFAGVEISGMLWYQGESNIKYAEDNGYNTFYEHALSGLIDSYSKAFGFENGNMPFVCAHLAPYNYASIRAEDYTTVLATFSEMLSKVTAETKANMIQIPIYDLSLEYKDPPINNPDPIHPNSKREVASRFATAVLAGVYSIGDKDAFTAPTVSSYQISGNKVILNFQNTGASLKLLSGNTLHGFAVAGSDRVFVKANAEIISATQVAVWSEHVSAPVAATYAWSSFNMAANLGNAAGIPAVPYRTDSIESVYDLSNDWGYCDSILTWDAVVSLEAGFKDAFKVSDNAAVSLVDDKLEGTAAVKLAYTNGTASVSPILNYGGMINQYKNYSGVTVYAKNSDSNSKTLSLELVAAGKTYKASVITGTSLATEYSLTSAYAAYTFNLNRLVNDEGKVLADSTTVLKTVTEIRFVVNDTKSGAVLFDNIYFRADKLPAPGSENDDIVAGVEDTTPGSLDSNGNMWLSDADTTAGWSTTGTPIANDTANLTQGKGSVGTTAAKGVLKQIVFSPGVSLDISSYDYLEFDVYFSNMEWFANCESMMFEMTSSGGSDNESNRYMKGYMRDNLPEFYAAGMDGSDKPGWYHVKLILDSPQTVARGGMNAKRFNYFRFFTIGSPDTTADFDIRFDNMKFTKEGSGEEVVAGNDPSYGKVIDKNSMWMTDGESLAFWTASAAEANLDFGNKTQGNSAVTVTAKGALLKQIAFVPTSSIDISDYQYLEFDVYFTNLDWFNKCGGMMFELTSAGVCDVESARYTKSSMLEASPVFAQDVENGTGGGKWYHFKLNLDRPHTSVKGGLDKKAFDYFRFYTVMPEAGTADYTMLLDNMKFTKGEKTSDIIKTDKEIILNNADSSVGWTSPGQEVMPDKNNKVEGEASVTVTAKNGILKELVYRPSEAVDLTGYRYLQFDLFLSDISFLNTSTGLMVELTSSGTCDVESNRYMKSAILVACPELAQDLALGDKGDKWYHFCFDLQKPQNQARGGLDMTAADYFRIYFIGAEEGTPDCVVNIDNLKITKEGIQGASTNTGGQTITITGGATPGKNVGNKLNGGLLAAALTPYPDDLVNTIIVLGAALAVVLIATVVFLILVLKKKKR